MTGDYTGTVYVCAKACVEIEAKPGVPHYKTLDIEKIKDVIEKESILRCYEHSFIEFDATRNEDSPITKFSIRVEYSNSCEFYKEIGGEPDEILFTPYEDDEEYDDIHCFETDELMIEITDIEVIKTEYGY